MRAFNAARGIIHLVSDRIAQQFRRRNNARRDEREQERVLNR